MNIGYNNSPITVYYESPPQLTKHEHRSYSYEAKATQTLYNPPQPNTSEIIPIILHNQKSQPLGSTKPGGTRD